MSYFSKCVTFFKLTCIVYLFPLKYSKDKQFFLFHNIFKLVKLIRNRPELCNMFKFGLSTICSVMFCFIGENNKRPLDGSS